MLDSSSSIGLSYYEKAKQFLADLINRFTIGQNLVRVGLIVYGNAPQLIFDLQTSFNKDDILNEIKTADYLDSMTATGDAISLMTNNGFTEQHGARAVGCAVPRVAIILTDGVSNTGMNVADAAKFAREQCIEMLAFGIGSDINSAELLEIAGSQDKVHRIDSFDNINDAKALISRGFTRGEHDVFKQHFAFKNIIKMQLHTVKVVTFRGLNFCGLGGKDNFMGFYFHGIVCI